jgi:hypothetical protein
MIFPSAHVVQFFDTPLYFHSPIDDYIARIFVILLPIRIIDHIEAQNTSANSCYASENGNEHILVHSSLHTELNYV